mgnify:FL=1
MKTFILFIIIIIFLFFFQCFSLKGQQYSKEAEKLVDKAVELIKEKNYTEAMKILDKAKSKDKNCWPVYFYTGIIYHFNADYTKAITNYKIFIKNAGSHQKLGTAFYNLGDCYYNTGKKKEAIVFVEKARSFFYNNNDRDYYIRSLKKLVDITSGSENKKYKEELSHPLPAVTPTATKTATPAMTPTKIPFTPTPTMTSTPVEHMAIIKEGEFYMGASDKDVDSMPEEKPLHKVYLNSYKIDICEVTNSQYCRFLNEKMAETDNSEYKWIDLTNEYCRITRSEDKYTVKPGGYENHPVCCVSWYGAVAYGKWCYKRLPSEAEWERAAKGKTNRIYTWGDIWDPFKCANDTGGKGTIMPVGSFPEGSSEDKIMDMAGNLYEWCSDWCIPEYYSMSPYKNPGGPADGIYKTVRGGSWNKSKNSYFRTTHRYSSLPVTTSPYVGFRLVKDVRQ